HGGEVVRPPVAGHVGLADPDLAARREAVEEGVALDRHDRRARPAAAGRGAVREHHAQRQPAHRAQEERPGDPRPRGHARCARHALGGVRPCLVCDDGHPTCSWGGWGGRGTRATPRRASLIPWRWISEVTLAVISGWRTSIRVTVAFVSGRRRPVSEAANTRAPAWRSDICTESRSPGGARVIS